VGLERFGLHRGEKIRFRRPDRGRWQDGVAVGIERDGSLAVHDRNGAARAIPVEAVLVQASGSRGGAHWEPLVNRAARTTQLELF
jgi:hypothetical protein